jgi:hypothetical protein
VLPAEVRLVAVVVVVVVVFSAEGRVSEREREEERKREREKIEKRALCVEKNEGRKNPRARGAA